MKLLLVFSPLLFERSGRRDAWANIAPVAGVVGRNGCNGCTKFKNDAGEFARYNESVSYQSTH